MNKKNSILKIYFKRILKRKIAAAGLFMILILSLVALLADFISPFRPEAQILEYANKPAMFKGKFILTVDNILKEGYKFVPVQEIISEDSKTLKYINVEGIELHMQKSNLFKGEKSVWYQERTFILGADKYGRDILSRLIYGSRVSLSVGLISESIAIIIGIILGALAGYFGGITDRGVSWLINVVWAFPSILIIISISVVLGKGFWQAFIAIGLSAWVDIARIVRGQVLSIKQTEYVEAARTMGFKSPRIVFRHILPNCISPVIVAGTAGLASAIIFEASLSFLGLGVQPPTPSWGQMLFDGYKYIIAGTHWGFALYPATAIMITVLSVNILGDGLRDILDPKYLK